MSAPASAPSPAYDRARRTALDVTGSLPGPASMLPADTPLQAASPVEVGPGAPAGTAERTGPRGLATERLTLLIGSGRPDHALQVIEALPDVVRRHGRTRLLEAVATTAAERADGARPIMDDVQVPDLAEGARDLGDLWLRLHPDLSIPQRLDFRMHDDGART